MSRKRVSINQRGDFESLTGLRASKPHPLWFVGFLIFLVACRSLYSSLIYPTRVFLKHTVGAPRATRPYLPAVEFGTETSERETVCQDFFTVLPSGTLGPRDSSQYLTGSCEPVFGDYGEHFEVLNARMERMGTKLFVYSDLTDTETRCRLDEFSYIQSVYFDPVELFDDRGLGGDVYSTVQRTWTKHYARLADAYRILLARKHKHSYLDLDVVFLSQEASVFMRPYVGVSVFKDAYNALEITNAAFCLPCDVLDRMTLFIYNRVLEGPAQYFYTEIGPSLFHKALLNSKAAVSMYSVPTSPDLHRLVRETIAYHHMLLHLSGHIQKGNPWFSYKGLVSEIEGRIKSAQRKNTYGSLRKTLGAQS